MAISDTHDVSQVAEPPNIIQLPLQAKSNSGEEHSQESTPLNVVGKNQLESKYLKVLPNLDHKKTVHTLAYIKGVISAIVCEFIYQVFQRAYYNALMRIPRLEFVYQGYEGRGTGGLGRVLKL